MRGTNSRITRRIAVVAAVTAAVGGAGVALGAYAFGGSDAAPSHLAVGVIGNGPARAQLAAVAPTALYPHRTRKPTAQPKVAARHAASRRVPAVSSFEGKLGLDDGLVKLKVYRVLGPAARSQLAFWLLEHRAVLQIGPGVRVVDQRGAQVSLALIDDAIVRVHGRLLPTASWYRNDDELRPVIRVQRVVVLQLDRGLGD
jgi:hypothetical protein